MKFKVICILIVIIFVGCCSKHKHTFNDINKEMNLKVFGANKFYRNTIVLMVPSLVETEDVIFLVLNKRNEIINLKIEKFNAPEYNPIFFNERFFVTTVRYRDFLIFDSVNNNFIKIDYNSFYVASLIIHKNNIYYSTEKTKYCIKKINLLTGEKYNYNIDAENSPFYLIDDNIYIKQYRTNKIFRIEKNNIVLDKLDIKNNQPLAKKKKDIQYAEDIDFFSKLLKYK